MPESLSTPSKVAAYYNDDSISKFYELCWGGSDIHIGKYDRGDETIADASAAMTQHLLAKTNLAQGARVLELACGFGGTLRRLAKMGCQVKGIDISQACVDYAREVVAAAELGDKIEVDVGDFHAIDSDDDAWDAVICQDSLVHSQDRPKVLGEVFRVLRPGGVFAFSDLLTAEGADLEQVEAALARLGAPAGITIKHYRDMARSAGFEITFAEERARDMKIHYDKLAEKLTEPVAGLDRDAAASIAKSLSRWCTALANGQLTMTCFVARKPV
jgi:sarcosine/dimethylglycine N-methyltransferase